jgi:hypothetical protein
MLLKRSWPSSSEAGLISQLRKLTTAHTQNFLHAPGRTNGRKSRNGRHRFPSEVVSYAVWAYHRSYLSLRDISDLLAERGVTVTYESIRVCFSARRR